ncbi:MAG: hypothetical protein Q8M16_03095 [Pirellulaceae bacterium]|nr:hypothetical protein [Pirellulaceae bacterium]
MTSHSLIVGVLLLLMGGAMLTLNIREAIELRDARNAAAKNADGSSKSAPSRVEPAVPSTRDAASPTDDLSSALGPTVKDPSRTDSNAEPEVNRIPRVRVAGLAMPLGVGLLLLMGAVVTWLAKSDQGVQVTATLAGVAGVLMLLLGLEHVGSLLNWGIDPLGRSALVLVTSGLLCLSLPSRWWWSRTNVDSTSSL